MAAVFYLCANHGSGNRAGQRLLRRIAGELEPGFRACHLGCFHGDDRRFSRVTVDFLTGLGARCSSPRLSDPKLDLARAREALETADLVYLDGGDTVAGVEHARARGLVESLQRAARSARVVFGLSGGACAAGPYTIGYGKGEEPHVAPCLDLGPPLSIDVHDEAADWPEMRALLELDPPHEHGLVIPTNAVLCVSERGALRSLGRPPVERRHLARDGTWRSEVLESIAEA